MERSVEKIPRGLKERDVEVGKIGSRGSEERRPKAKTNATRT